MVLEIVKLVLSATWIRPPLDSLTGFDRDSRKTTRVSARLNAGPGPVGRQVARLRTLEDPEIRRGECS